jgi:hypothetical protein
MDASSTTGTHSQEWVPGCVEVLAEVLEERHRQVARYGHNDDLDMGMGPNVRWLLPYTQDSAVDVEQALRTDYEDYEDDTGQPTWTHLLREEFAEAVMEADPVKREQELIQLAALCASCVESSRKFRGALPS